MQTLKLNIMKKLSVLSGVGILAFILSSFVGKGECLKSKELHEGSTALTELQQPFIHELLTQNENNLCLVKDILFIEIEEEIDLGFDTADYLPVGFDAYAGMELDLKGIDFIEIEEDIDWGFDTADYLPVGFDAYAGMELDLKGIDFVEFEEEIDLGFDTADYLPVGFDAYAGMELNLNEIDFIEFEEEIDLGFDTANYLPVGFDAYTNMVIETTISF
tara:strand:- start:157081 stop:157734 length:654 start_codon:yes stop_codon:yes gene_type:complete